MVVFLANTRRKVQGWSSGQRTLQACSDTPAVRGVVVANGLETCGGRCSKLRHGPGESGLEVLAPRALQTTRLCLIISLPFLSIRPSAPDPSRHLPAQSGAPLCARALPVYQNSMGIKVGVELALIPFSAVLSRCK